MKANVESRRPIILEGGRKLELAPLLLALVVSAAQAQNFSVNWSTIDGGGGTSTGGVYAVAGTIAQPDAGRMSGSHFTLDGGFWGLIAIVQAPDAPRLTTTLNPHLAAMTISWPAVAEGWVLKETAEVKSTNWVQVAQTPQEVGGCKQVVVTPLVGSRFYRLHKP